MVDLGVIFFAVFLGAFFATASGFGYALIATPILSMIMPVKEAVILILFSTIILRVFTMLRVRGEYDTKTVCTVSLGSIIGSIPGSMVLKFITANVLEMFLGATLLVATWLMHREFYFRIDNKNAGRLGVGFLSGFFGAATSVSGPPIVLYFLNEGTTKKAMRANMIWIFGVTGVTMLLANYWAGNTLLVEDLSVIFYTIPAVFAGIFAGELAFKNISQRIFRNFSLAIVCSGALLLLCNGLRELF